MAPWAAAGLIAYLLVPQLAKASRAWNSFGSPVWAWVGVAVAAMILTHVMGAVVLTGSTLTSLSYPKTLAVQFMVSFTNRLAPSGLGGMATTAWYLRRSGADRSAAAAAVALISAVGFVVHLAAIGVAVGWAGAAATGRFRLPDWWPIAGATVAVSAAVMASASWRHRRSALADRVHAVVRHFTSIVSSQRHLSMLLGGSVGVTASYALAFWASLHAFVVRISAPDLLVAFLGASALAAASPTPGGIGAAEAALVTVTTGLVGQSGPVIDAVLAYRLITYWFPVLPGAAAFVCLRRRTHIPTMPDAPESTAPGRTPGGPSDCGRVPGDPAPTLLVPAGG
ncbi:MAG TPA: YbhN family protein [Candidatus Dormibacteraeota bacterium]|nr:YbhN family protein [Candidatus Dormibacteraeota bacterium]